MGDNHHKENSPRITILNIRKILSRHDITVFEKKWYNTKDRCRSLSLEVDQTPFSVNGKGVTTVFAIASAYGELMERMQNMTIFKLINNDMPCVESVDDFYYAPDEKLINKDDFFKSISPWLKKQYDNMASGIDRSEIKDIWSKMSMCDDKDGFISLPFFGMKNKKVEYIPLVMLSKMYTSNGMAAGNTLGEAMVQGLSEIYERYATKIIIKEEICPPEIPRKVIFEDELLYEMIKNIEASGRYRLHFKDCSLGIGLPVAAAVCIDSFTGKYFVKFGAHPVFSIVIERTLTEMLQGQNMDEIKGMAHLGLRLKSCDEDENIYGIFINGIGNYPAKFFSNKPDYGFMRYQKNDDKNNDELLCDMLKYIDKKGWDIYIRDVSFLGFPACQILIPGISEVEYIDSFLSIERYLYYLDLKNQVKTVNDMNEQELRELAKMLSDDMMLKSAPPQEWLNLVGNAPWIFNSTIFIVCAIYILLDDYMACAGLLNDYIDSSQGFLKAQETSYFKCCVSVLEMIGDGINTIEIHDALSIFYSHDMIENALKDFCKSNIKNAFYVVSNGEYNKDLSELEALYKKLKRAYGKNIIDQECVMEVL